MWHMKEDYQEKLIEAIVEVFEEEKDNENVDAKIV